MGTVAVSRRVCFSGQKPESRSMKQLAQQNATAGHQGDDVAILLVKAETLCRTVAARDLESTPLYIIPTSDLPDNAGGASICSGYTTSSLDLYLRDYIPNYHGRGPCMVVEYPIDGDFLPEDIAHFTLVTALHELAHILDRPTLFANRTGVSPLKLKFESLVVGQASRRLRRTNLPAHFGHGIEFIRVCLHLRYRAKLAGVHIAPNNLCAGWQYGLSHASRYARALGDEPARRVEAKFREILTTPIPGLFHDRWLNDISS